MGINIKNHETDRLVRELAGMRGISLVDAVHEAVQDKLLQQLRMGTEHPGRSAAADQPMKSGPQTSVIEAIDERRLLMARYDGMDRALDAIKEDIFVPALLCMLMLLATPLLGDKLPVAVIGVTLASAGLLLSYWRNLAREKASRNNWRQSVAKEMRALCVSLPDDLMFMAWIPDTTPALEEPKEASVGDPQPAPDSAR